MWSKIRKALVAFGGTFVSAEVAAIVKAGGAPGWPATGAAVLLAAGAAYAVWRVPNATDAPVPAPVAPPAPAAGGH